MKFKVGDFLGCVQDDRVAIAVITNVWEKQSCYDYTFISEGGYSDKVEMYEEWELEKDIELGLFYKLDRSELIALMDRNPKHGREVN